MAKESQKITVEQTWSAVEGVAQEVSPQNLELAKSYLGASEVTREKVEELGFGRDWKLFVNAGAEQLAEDDPVFFVPVKGFSPTVLGSDPHPALAPEFKNAIAEGASIDNLKSFSLAHSFNALVSMMMSYRLLPFGYSWESNPKRHNFEHNMAHMSGLGEMQAGPIYGVLGHEKEGDLVIKDLVEKIRHYIGAVLVMIDDTVMDYSTFTLGDSTNGGMLNRDMNLFNYELGEAFDKDGVVLDPAKLKALDQKYPGFTYASQTFMGATLSIALPTATRVKGSIMLRKEAEQLENWLRFLKKMRVVASSEYLETQMYRYADMSQMQMRVLKSHQSEWETVRDYMLKSPEFAALSANKRAAIKLLIDQAEPVNE